MVKSRSVKRNGKNTRGLGRDIFLTATAPFPKSSASYFRFARFNTSALYILSESLAQATRNPLQEPPFIGVLSHTFYSNWTGHGKSLLIPQSSLYMQAILILRIPDVKPTRFIVLKQNQMINERHANHILEIFWKLCWLPAKILLECTPKSLTVYELYSRGKKSSRS